MVIPGTWFQSHKHLVYMLHSVLEECLRDTALHFTWHKLHFLFSFFFFLFWVWAHAPFKKREIKVRSSSLSINQVVQLCCNISTQSKPQASLHIPRCWQSLMWLRPVTCNRCNLGMHKQEFHSNWSDENDWENRCARAYRAAAHAYKTPSGMCGAKSSGAVGTATPTGQRLPPRIPKHPPPPPWKCTAHVPHRTRTKESQAMCPSGSTWAVFFMEITPMLRDSRRTV